MKFKSMSKIERLGINLENIDQKDLEGLANFIAHNISDALSSILGSRILGYINTISIEIQGDTITVAIDLEVDSYLIPRVSLENILDKVLNYAFTKTKVYLSSRYRKNKEPHTE